jgi:hypothetical protein
MTGSALDAAYLRVARGREHLAGLESACADACDDYADQLSELYPPVVHVPDELLALFDQTHPEPRIPPTIPLLVGEIVYNFRAALDYLIGYVSRTDSPNWPRKRRNQFPIERTQDGFDARRETFLAGLSDAHVIAIAEYQPYAGCAWTTRLADLSNRDKHNDLIVVRQGIDIRLQESEGDEPGHVTIKLHLRLEHDDVERVIETLEALGREVTKVLDSFR